ncbi:MAG: hypothetical protein K9N06_14290 [Candidatus Cloacimonetes bacterium]|nr:hypothetical protein [Candidatus Cloacimonadota bacterium]
MNVFRKKPLQDRDIWQKLWGKRISENFLIELNNLLADKPLLQIRLEEVNRLCRRYKVSNISQFSRRLAGFYHSYLQYCLEDRKLSNDEIQELSHLKGLLGLSDRTVKEVHQSLATAIYGQELEKTMNDRKIDHKEQSFLEELCRNLYLPEELAQRIQEEKAGKKLTRKLLEIMGDKRITPEEERDFNLLSENLGFKPGLDERTEANFERYKMYWQVENGELPRIEPGIHLQVDERCHFQAEANWYETEKSTANLETGELQGRIRVPRGAFWRSDNENLSGLSASDWKAIDSGTMLLTNQRLIYMGKMGRMVILLENISGLIPYNDAVLIQRRKGKSPLVELSEEESDIFALMLNRLLSEEKE